MSIELKRSRFYDKNEKFADGDLPHCCICGKAIEEPQHWLHIHCGGTHVVTEAEAAQLNAEGHESADLYFFPAGVNCLKQHPELKDYVQSFTREQPEINLLDPAKVAQVEIDTRYVRARLSVHNVPLAPVEPLAELQRLRDSVSHLQEQLQEERLHADCLYEENRVLQKQVKSLKADYHQFRCDLGTLYALEGATDAGEMAQRREILGRYS